MTIDKVYNGYILNLGGTTEVYKEDEVEKMFNRILQYLTGRASSFRDDRFGEVKINFDYALRKG